MPKQSRVPLGSYATCFLLFVDCPKFLHHYIVKENKGVTGSPLLLFLVRQSLDPTLLPKNCKG